MWCIHDAIETIENVRHQHRKVKTRNQCQKFTDIIFVLEVIAARSFPTSTFQSLLLDTPEVFVGGVNGTNTGFPFWKVVLHRY